MNQNDLIYDWNDKGGGYDYRRCRVELNDETLRDGLQAAISARCVDKLAHDHFWHYHESAYLVDSGYTARKVHAMAIAEGIPEDRFKACLTDTTAAGLVNRDVSEATRLGLQATPSFVIGRSARDSINGVVVQGALPEAVFASVIDSLLSKP